MYKNESPATHSNFNFNFDLIKVRVQNEMKQ